MNSRVGRLELRVRAPPNPVPGLSVAAEDFARRVLGRCDALLERRAPGRVVLVRQLAMSWRLFDQALRDDGEIEAVAAEVTRALDRMAGDAVALGTQVGDVAVFDDEAHWRASYLAGLASGETRGDWRFARLAAEGEAPGVLRELSSRAIAEAVLDRLLVDGDLVATLTALPPRGLADLAAAVGAPRPERVSTSPRASASPAARQSVDALPAQTVPLVAAVSLLAMIRARIGPSSPTKAAELADDALALYLEDERRRGDASATPPATAASSFGAIERTAFGGVAYLFRPVLELGIAEALWKACLPEGTMLGEVAALVLGPPAAGDPAPRLLGGDAADATRPAVSSEQQREVARATLVSLVAALPRRGLAVLRAPLLGFVHDERGRMLVAAAPGSPFALFAWPATSTADTRAGIQTFLSAWPASAPRPRAAPGLAELDRTTRIAAERGVRLSPDLLIAASEDLPTASLLTQIAGALCALASARTRAEDVDRAADLVARHLTVPARIESSPDAIVVRMPMDRIDLAVRLAGLDADPGWVPWLGRTVRIEFEGDGVP